MHKIDMLARLIAEAQASGSDLVTLRAIVEEATDVGSERALQKVGLGDERRLRAISMKCAISFGRGATRRRAPGRLQ